VAKKDEPSGYSPSKTDRAKARDEAARNTPEPERRGHGTTPEQDIEARNRQREQR